MDLVHVTEHRLARSRDDLRLAPGETVLAGGTWLFSEPQDVTGLVDLTTLEWPEWELLPAGGLRVAATCTVARLPEAPVPSALARQCADALLMSWKVQQSATVGGNLCLALPAGAMISLFAALGAEVVIWTPDGGDRREPVATFVRGVRQTSLRDGEVVRAIDVPASALGATTAFRRAALTPLGRSSAIAVGVRDDTGVLVAVTAATTRPVVVGSVAELDAVDCWWTDAHGAADWRAAVTRVLVGEVLDELGGEGA